MAKLPRLSGKEVIKALSKAGFILVRRRGSHIIMAKQTEKRQDSYCTMHSEIDTGTLLEIIRQSKLSKEEFLSLL